ncbi:hypothetical protein LEP1GSC058_0247 [Leptospira fainei serovar Hurstbridge str. BUT 6]|uniref:Uncharacterized protein n=1 Tax=Leptospira fainei serovar Hurstbridge str. BUT 6 TaxID=1193011 RepID=S3UVM9_9LEPT|nr:hypothetical protein LEP1GSC058_0247 [Leptospira fainei serovar Hurstbridge str. BUT 6]
MLGTAALHIPGGSKSEILPASKAPCKNGLSDYFPFEPNELYNKFSIYRSDKGSISISLGKFFLQ